MLPKALLASLSLLASVCALVVPLSSRKTEAIQLLSFDSYAKETVVSTLLKMLRLMLIEIVSARSQLLLLSPFRDCCDSGQQGRSTLIHPLSSDRHRPRLLCLGLSSLIHPRRLLC